MFQTISGILGVFFILLPKKLPVDKKASWNSETKMGNHIEVIPMILPPMETPIESRDNAIARNIDSLASILLSYKYGKIIDMNNNMKEIKYEDTEVYRIYKDFLNNPYGMQKVLFEE